MSFSFIRFSGISVFSSQSSRFLLNSSLSSSIDILSDRNTLSAIDCDVKSFLSADHSFRQSSMSTYSIIRIPRQSVGKSGNALIKPPIHFHDESIKNEKKKNSSASEKSNVQICRIGTAEKQQIDHDKSFTMNEEDWKSSSETSLNYRRKGTRKVIRISSKRVHPTIPEQDFNEGFLFISLDIFFIICSFFLNLDLNSTSQSKISIERVSLSSRSQTRISSLNDEKFQRAQSDIRVERIHSEKKTNDNTSARSALVISVKPEKATEKSISTKSSASTIRVERIQRENTSKTTNPT